MTNGEGETTLVDRGRAGDRAAFEELVHRTARGLFARIYLDVGDPHRAQDLVQETYLRAWKKLATLSDPKMFRGWLNAIAVAVVVDDARHQARKKRRWWGSKAVRDQEALLELADSRPGPVERAELTEERRRVLAILSELPPEYQQVLSLRYLAGADYHQIAQQLAISNGSLRGLLNRGMKMLRERIGETTDEHR